MVADDMLWVAKYRPKDFNEMVMTDSYKNRLNHYITSKTLNHCLFCGKSGTGKTSTALILKDAFIKGDYDFIFMNASDDRGINAIRDTVIEFMKTPPIDNDIKIVIMDEADSLTPDAWKALRNPIENDNINVDLKTKILFTANYISGIPDFIQSRCDCYEFQEIPMDFMVDKSKEILKNENVNFSDTDVESTVSDFYPDMRAVINALQSNSLNGTYTYSHSSTPKIELINLVKETIKYADESDFQKAIRDLYEVRQITSGSLFDYIAVTRDIFDSDGIPFEVFSVMNHYLNSFKDAVDKRNHFIAMIADSILTMRRLSNDRRS